MLRPTKQIQHDPSNGHMAIKTVTTFKNFDMDFYLGKEFTEDLGAVDGRKCQVCVHVCVFEDDTEYCKDFSLMRSHRIGVCVGGGCVSIDASALL